MPPNDVSLPVKPFLYTLDQLSSLLAVSEQNLKTLYLHFDGRSIGPRPKDRILARNIAPADAPPDWRVAEKELMRYLRYKGFKFHERGWVRHS